MGQNMLRMNFQFAIADDLVKRLKHPNFRCNHTYATISQLPSHISAMINKVKACNLFVLAKVYYVLLNIVSGFVLKSS